MSIPDRQTLAQTRPLRIKTTQAIRYRTLQTVECRHAKLNANGGLIEDPDVFPARHQTASRMRYFPPPAIRARETLTLLALCLMLTNFAWGQSPSGDLGRLLSDSCLACHDADTDTGLNLEDLRFALEDGTAFRKWEQIFDRVRTGEMPPPTEEQPAPELRSSALDELHTALLTASRKRQRQHGRVPARRLTKLELGYSLQDLLHISGDVTSAIPDEVESGLFDTVGATQRISAVHMEAYMKAADEALNLAIRLGPNPYRSAKSNYAYLDEWHEKPLQLGGSVTKKLDRGVALFVDIDYLTQFQLPVFMPGNYRLTTEVEAYQSRKPVIVKIILKEPSGAARLLTSADLTPGEPRTITVDAYLRPGDLAYVTYHTGKSIEQSYIGLATSGGAKFYKGPGIAIRSQQAEGPVTDRWPPHSTTELLGATRVVPARNPLTDGFRFEAGDSPEQTVAAIISELAPEVFRRPVSESEIEAVMQLARPALERRQELDAVRIALRALLSSPQFLLFAGEPGQLADHALASRLSYFLWKSVPDRRLLDLAAGGTLSEPAVLSAEVDRLLEDPRAERFVQDFVGQWLRLNKINATTPDDKLYPEYDELLGAAMPRETQLFFAELINGNLPLDNLIDSDFTFVNRRLAAHYGLPEISGQHFRRVSLPPDSPRGGVLTQAAVLKTTANGTVTSPVTRGNFVLTNFLGTPPSPPPPSVGSIEPDTRGKTTIREILAAHRNIETCAKCHRVIDPPGFALESFDPIGGYRTNYRASASPGGLAKFFGVMSTWRDGPPVDATGVTADGKPFAGISDYKRHLLTNKEQVARSFVSQLAVYATGAEIQFADRSEIDAILDRTRAENFRVRDIIHEIVSSRLFTHK